MGTTSLIRFAEEHAEQFHTVFVDARAAAVAGHAEPEQLLVIIVEETLKNAQESGFGGRLSEDSLQDVYDWFAETFTEVEEGREQSTRAEVSAGAGVPAPLQGILNLGALLKRDIRSGSKVLKRSISQETHRTDELIDRCGKVIAVYVADASNDQGCRS